MFRIKNIRNATVAKNTNIPPPLPQAPTLKATQKQPIIQSKPPVQIHIRPIQRQQGKKNEEIKLKAPEGQRKLIIATKPNQNKVVPPKKFVLQPKTGLIEKKLQVRDSNPKKEGNKQNKRMMHILMNCQNNSPDNISPNEAHQSHNAQQKKQTSQHINPQQAKYLQLPSKQLENAAKELKQVAQNQQLMKLRAEQEEKRIKQEQERKRQQQERRDQLEEQRRIKRQREEEQEKANEIKMKEMMEKVNARRKARQEEKERRINFQREMENQAVGGMIALSDPLAHVQMSEAVMDAQVAMLLNMKFAGYPNQQAIERQVQELERINRSYLLVRTDPSNPLIKGLANFRIQLFNRVGELIMQGQGQLGPAASGLQVIQSDSKNYPQIKGMQVTRGLQGHVQNLLKKRIVDQAEECGICLCEIEAGSSVFEVGCGHQFHLGCLEEWLNNNANCPVCRYNIKYDHR